ncbi:MAG: alpha/beta fold hydrolase, partial [Bacteroidales bacterium]|nr:alpha/beta fold hydrolase [Bacteroidales bacterium]
MKKVTFIILALLLSTGIFASSRPYTFVLVHGAWHGDWAWFIMEHKIKQTGADVISINLPGHGLDDSEPGDVELEDYVNTIYSAIDTISTNQVILVGHSMAGIAISATAEAYPDKIDKLVYLAGFLLQDGSSLLDEAILDTESLILPNISIDTLHQKVDINLDKVMEIFYNDSTHLPLVTLSQKLLTPEPLIPLATPLTLTVNNYGSIPRYYIETLNDKAVTPTLQQRMYTNLPCRKVYRINSEHSPFLTR